MNIKNQAKTTQYIALLRAINVGGHNKMKMSDLREVLEANGLLNVQSYIQSGNLILDSSRSAAEVEKLITNAIESKYSYDVPVLVRKVKFFRDILATNPFAKKPIEHRCMTICSKKPKSAHVKALEAMDFGDVQFKIAKDVVYILCPNGVAKSKLTNGLIEKKLETKATSRNWKTITRLVSMADA